MVVHVGGTGCQILVENDHKVGCAASVEHTPHPLGRPSSYTPSTTVLYSSNQLVSYIRFSFCCVYHSYVLCYGVYGTYTQYFFV